MAKKAFRVILLILAAVIIAAAMLLLYLTVTEYRPADKEDAAILSAKGTSVLREGDDISLLSWNIGYAGLGAGSDFFMDAVTGAFRACSAGDMYPGGRIALPISGEHNNGQWLTAVCRNMPYFGSKFSAVFPGNKEYGMPVDQSTISLYSNVNGEQLALIGANYLTALKTGAGAGVATDLLARKDACTLGIIGTGFQAYAQVLAIQEIRELKQLRLFNRHVYEARL